MSPGAVCVGRAKIEQIKIEQICMQVKTEMKTKVGKDLRGGSKKFSGE